MKQNRGSTLLVALFIGLVAISIAISMMQLSSTKTVNAVNNKYSVKAFYAAETGINEAIDVLSDNMELLPDAPTPEELSLPTKATPATIDGAEYYVEISYIDDESFIIESTGSYKGAKKRIRSKVAEEFQYSYNFGMLSDDVLTTQSGNVLFNVDMHGNKGMAATGAGQINNKNGALATQSAELEYTGKVKEENKDFWGLYRPEVYVPPVDFDYFNTEVADGIIPDPAEANLEDVLGIDNFDVNIKIEENYLRQNPSVNIPEPPEIISLNYFMNRNIITLAYIPLGITNIQSQYTITSNFSSLKYIYGVKPVRKLEINIPAGDYGGRIYYIDNKNIGSVDININGLVENIVIVATGDVSANGSQTIADKNNQKGTLDTIIAAGGNITHNGKLYTGAMYWTNGNFLQNGSSIFENGRVMAQGQIELNGTMEATSDKPLSEQDFIPTALYVKSWQEIPVD